MGVEVTRAKQVKSMDVYFIMAPFKQQVPQTSVKVCYSKAQIRTRIRENSAIIVTIATIIVISVETVLVVRIVAVVI